MTLMISETLSKILSQQPPNVLYHYTTGQGYLGIIKSKEIWATSIHYLNDASEFTLASEIAKKVLREVKNSENERLASKILDGMESFESVNICVSSFSEQKDQLSQWRAYGGEFGFSIGFKVERLQEVAKKYNFVLVPCCYDSSVQEKIIFEIVNFFIKKFRAEISRSVSKEDKIIDVLCGSVGLDCAKEITKIAPILKHNSFEEEKEWRIISEPKSTKDPKMDFHPGKSMIVPFFHLNLQADNKPLDIIKEVYVGPTPHIRQARKAATSVLTKHNFDDWSVYKSSTPYRNW